MANKGFFAFLTQTPVLVDGTGAYVKNRGCGASPEIMN